MNKMMMAVAGLAMAVVLTGCGGSPKSVAVDFAEAMTRRDMDKLLSLVDTTMLTEKEIKDAKEHIENDIIKKDTDINDDKLSAVAINEEIDVPSETAGYTIRNGKKYTGERARVLVQFLKGKDKKKFGLVIKLEKVDGTWKVSGQSKKPWEKVENLDTAEK